MWRFYEAERVGCHKQQAAARQIHTCRNGDLLGLESVARAKPVTMQIQPLISLSMKILTQSRSRPFQCEEIRLLQAPNAESLTAWSIRTSNHIYLSQQASIDSRTMNYGLDSIAPDDIHESLLCFTEREFMCDHLSKSHTLGTQELHR